MSSAANHLAPRHASVRSLQSTALAILIRCARCVSREEPPKGSAALLKYDPQTETKAKGVVVKLFSFGTRKDFIGLILKGGSGTIVLYMCPMPFEDEMGVTFSKGDRGLE